MEPHEVGDYAPWMAEFIAKICLIRKLRETRVLAGFSRLFPPDAENVTKGIQPLHKSRYLSWLPATVVRGEGIFFEFRADCIASWCDSENVNNRIAGLEERYNHARLERGLSHTVVTPKFVLLHTFAHLLIRQLSFDCGYGSAALRERIYCDLEEEGSGMQGVLIYTAAGDFEGTMGGLVRKGEPGNIESSVLSALRSASWCSSDPVCIETEGQGTESSNLAACHACTLLPETSCEMGNRLLDRALIFGTPREPQIGLFSAASLRNLA